MAIAVGKKFVDPAKNEIQIVRCEYDFAKDGGSIAAYELMEATGDIVIHEAHVNVTTAVTSGGSATIDIGKTGATTGLLNAAAISGFSAGAVVATTDATTPVKVADGEKVLMEVKVAALTAGKFEVVLHVSKF